MAAHDHDGQDDPAHVTHRPFHQRQIESAFNPGRSDSEKDRVGEEGAKEF